MDFAGINIEVQQKNVRNLRLVVRKDGSVRLTVPYHCSPDNVLLFLEKNREWITVKAREAKSRSEKEASLYSHSYVEGEVFICWGNEYKLHISEHEAETKVVASDGVLQLHSVRPLLAKQRMAALNAWYVRQLKDQAERLISLWLDVMNEGPICQLRFKAMKSRWGSCMPSQRIICLNTRLVFYPVVCLEEVIVHELCHLKEASHNARFHALMAHYLPDYKKRSALLKEK